MESNTNQSFNNLTVNDEYRINFNFNITGLNNVLINDNGILIQKTILIFGKTGAGKSSILNSVTNKSSNIFREGETNGSETQEVNAVVHKLFNSGFNCLFIDSPGLFDSGNKDKENIMKISNFVKKSGFSIILFAHSILESKIDNSFYQTLEMLIEIFGKNVMERVYFVLTHLNQLNKNKIDEKINIIKSEFNKIVKTNKNEFLFYDYENTEDNNFGLKRLEDILKSYKTLLIPISKEESDFLNLLQTKQLALKSEEKLLINEFESANNKFTILFNNSQIEVTKKQNELNDELSTFKNTIEKSIRDNQIAKQQQVNDYELAKNNEFNAYKTERMNYKTQKQKEFVNLGGSYVGDSYTISSNNSQQLYNIFNDINSIPNQIQTKANSINVDMRNHLNNINQQIQNFNNQKTTEFNNKKTELDNRLQTFLRGQQTKIDQEKVKLKDSEINVNTKIKDLNLKLSQVQTELNYFNFKKNNSNFSVTLHQGDGKNYCIVNNILNKDSLVKGEASNLFEKTISYFKEIKTFVFDVEFSKNYFSFQNSNKTARFNKKAEVNLINFSDYNLYPVARINLPIKKKFRVQFKMESYGWFGIGNTNLISDGFPGYTVNGWMVCTDGRIFHNKNQIYHLGINSQCKEAFLECDVEDKKLSLLCNDNFNSVYIENMPSEVYFVVSFSEGSGVDLLKFYLME